MNLIQLLKFYLNNFYWQDFTLIGICLLLFFIIIIIALMLRKFNKLAGIILISSLFISIGAFIYGNDYINTHYRPHTLQVQSGKRLEYSDNIYFQIKLSNLSTHPYKICKVKIQLLLPSKNKLEQLVHFLRPIKIYNMDFKNIAAQESIQKDLVLALKSKKTFISKASATCF